MVLCFHKTAPILTALSFYDTVLSLTIFHIIYAQCHLFFNSCYDAMTFSLSNAFTITPVRITPIPNVINSVIT